MIYTVLVVDDDELARSAVEVALSSLPDLRILCAANGADAMSIILDEAIDAVITDLRMPVLDGFELAAQVRQSNVFDRLPILVITADEDAQTPSRLKELNINAVLQKPFSNAQLRSTVQDLLPAG